MKNNILIALCGGLFIVSSASADAIISPGTNNQASDNFTGQLSGLTLLSSTSGAFTSITYTGTYLAAVYTGAQNNGIAGFCAGGTNCLTYVYQVDDMSGNSNGAGGFFAGLITNLSASSFAGFTTDAGFSTTAVGTQPSPGTAGFTTGFATGTNVTPTNDSRDPAAGAGVEWNFNTNITPGSYSDILVVETNATAFVPGLFAGLGNATTTVNAYGATTLAGPGTPEPATMVLFGSALVGLGLLRKRIRG